MRYVSNQSYNILSKVTSAEHSKIYQNKCIPKHSRLVTAHLHAVVPALHDGHVTLLCHSASRLGVVLRNIITKDWRLISKSNVIVYYQTDSYLLINIWTVFFSSKSFFVVSQISLFFVQFHSFFVLIFPFFLFSFLFPPSYLHLHTFIPLS